MTMNEIYNQLLENMIDGIIAHAQLYNNTQRGVDADEIKDSIALWSEWLVTSKSLYDKLADELIEHGEGAIGMRLKKCSCDIDK